MEMPGSIDDFCYWVRDLNKGIRFAGLASSKGKLVGYAYRKSLKPLATIEEEFGQTIHAYARYRNVKRATIQVMESSKLTHIFMASFDTGVEHEPIILN